MDAAGCLQRVRALLVRYRRVWILGLDAVVMVWLLAAVNATIHAAPMDRWIALVAPASGATVTQLLIFEAGRPYRPNALGDLGLAVMVYSLAIVPLLANFVLFLSHAFFPSRLALTFLEMVPILYAVFQFLLVVSWHAAGTETLKRFGTKRNLSAFQFLLTGTVVMVYMSGSFVEVVDFELLIVPVVLLVGTGLGIVQWRFLSPFVAKATQTQTAPDSEITFRRAG